MVACLSFKVLSLTQCWNINFINDMLLIILCQNDDQVMKMNFRKVIDDTRDELNGGLV